MLFLLCRLNDPEFFFSLCNHKNEKNKQNQWSTFSLQFFAPYSHARRLPLMSRLVHFLKQLYQICLGAREKYKLCLKTSFPIVQTAETGLNVSKMLRTTRNTRNAWLNAKKLSMDQMSPVMSPVMRPMSNALMMQKNEQTSDLKNNMKSAMLLPRASGEEGAEVRSIHARIRPKPKWSNSVHVLHLLRPREKNP